MVKINEELITVKQYQEICNLYDHAINTMMGDLTNMIQDINKNSGREVVHSFCHRIKAKESLEKKMYRKECDVSKINDIAGIKIVVLFEDDIPIVADMIEDLFHVKDTKDYLESPKSNGYRGIHKIITVKTTVNGRTMSAPIEIQIKTVLQDAIWSMEHVVRYKKDDYDPNVTEIVSKAADRLENLEQDMISARDYVFKNS